MEFIKKFIKFESYITPTVVKILYILMIVLLLLVGVAGIFMALYAMTRRFSEGMIMLGMVAGYWVIGIPLLLISYRVGLETVSVIFDIHDNLKKIVEAKGGQGQ